MGKKRNLRRQWRLIICGLWLAGLIWIPGQILAAEPEPAQPYGRTLAPASPSGELGPPAMPASFYGTVTVNGGNPSTPVTVTARIGGRAVGMSGTFLYHNQIYYALDIPADDPATPEVDGGREGDLVLFFVGSMAAQSALWHGGRNLVVDLAVGAAPELHNFYFPFLSASPE